MYRKDELMHYGIKGMKWRRRKSALYRGAGEGITNVYSSRQKQLAKSKPGSKLGTKPKADRRKDFVDSGVRGGQEGLEAVRKGKSNAGKLRNTFVNGAVKGSYSGVDAKYKGEAITKKRIETVANGAAAGARIASEALRTGASSGNNTGRNKSTSTYSVSSEYNAKNKNKLKKKG